LVLVSRTSTLPREESLVKRLRENLPRLASIVLGPYRHVAFERPDLRTVVADLDRTVARSVGEEDFVTAVLLEERGGTLTIVNCGHPAPLLLRRGTVSRLDPPATAPPLGFMPVVRPRVERLEPADRVLMFTDGLDEARRDGEFFPITELAWGLLGHGRVDHGLEEHVHAPVGERMALALADSLHPVEVGAKDQKEWRLGHVGVLGDLR